MKLIECREIFELEIIIKKYKNNNFLLKKLPLTILKLFWLVNKKL